MREKERGGERARGRERYRKIAIERGKERVREREGGREGEREIEREGERESERDTHEHVTAIPLYVDREEQFVYRRDRQQLANKMEMDNNYWCYLYILSDLRRSTTLYDVSSLHDPILALLIFARVIHTRCCHIRIHAFAFSLTVMRSSEEQGSSSSQQQS